MNAVCSRAPALPAGRRVRGCAACLRSLVAGWAVVAAIPAHGGVAQDFWNWSMRHQKGPLPPIQQNPQKMTPLQPVTKPGYRTTVSPTSQEFYRYIMQKVGTQGDESLTAGELWTIQTMISTRQWPDRPDVLPGDVEADRLIQAHDTVASNLAEMMQVAGAKRDYDLPPTKEIEQFRDWYYSKKPGERSTVANAMMHWYRSLGYDMRSDSQRAWEEEKAGEAQEREEAAEDARRQAEADAREREENARSDKDFFEAARARDSLMDAIRKSREEGGEPEGPVAPPESVEGMTGGATVNPETPGAVAGTLPGSEGVAVGKDGEKTTPEVKTDSKPDTVPPDPPPMPEGQDQVVGGGEPKGTGEGPSGSGDSQVKGEDVPGGTGGASKPVPGQVTGTKTGSKHGGPDGANPPGPGETGAGEPEGAGEGEGAGPMAGGPGPDDGSPRNDAGQQVDPGQYQGGDSIVTKDGTEYQNQGGQWVKTGKNFGPYDPNSGSKGDGLKDSEPKAGDPGDGVAGGSMPGGGALTGFIGDRGDRAGAHADSSFGLMAGQQSVSQASASGDRATREAKNTLDSAGNEAQSTGAKTAGATAAGDRENGWGKAIADGIQQGVEKGLTQAGDSFGQGAADKASSAIFKGGVKSGGADTSGGAAAGGAATAAGGTPVGAAGGVQVASTGSKSGGGHGTKSGGGSKTSPGSKGNKGSSGGGSSSGVSSGAGATGGGSFSGIGHCPKCGRTDLVESVYDREGMTVHDWRCPSCNVTGHSGPPPPGLGGSSPASPAPVPEPPLPVVSPPSPAPPPPVEKKQRCPICKSASIKYTNTHYLYGDVYHCGGCGAAFKGRDIVVE